MRTIFVSKLPDVADFHAALPAWLSQALPGYLPRQRWFGDKARTIRTVEVDDVLPVIETHEPAALCLIDVSFTSGPPARYLIPVAIVAGIEVDEIDPLLQLNYGTGRAFLVDGLHIASVRQSFPRALTGSQSILGRRGALKIDTIADESPLTAALNGPSRVLGVEQSNTSIVYGSDVLIKVYRRLQTGIQPDVELTRFLTLKSGFKNTPRYLGAIEYSPDSGPPIVLAVAQSFVKSSGDGWSFVLASIRSHLDDPGARWLLDEARPIADRLGVVTASMHLALASDPRSSDFAPEPIKHEDVERWNGDYLLLLDQVASALSSRTGDLTGTAQDLARMFAGVAPDLRNAGQGFERLAGRAKTRVHGDYHLGQTLHTLDGDFVVIDFEGEPQRTIEERRRKTSPLKDVAGMLRSFSYARGTATAWLNESTGLLPSDLVAWERLMRQEFLQAYERTVVAGGGGFLPVSHADFQTVLTAWELDKAAYEVLYELNNRPDWLWIPLSSMVKRGEPGS